MMRFLLALPLLLGFAQDDAAIRDLIKRLDDTDLEVREKALKDLIQAGPKALDALKKALASESAEVRSRAGQAIRAIELERSRGEVCPPYRKFTLKRSGTVGEILDDLVRETGIQAEASKEFRDRKAEVDASTVFQALDQVCAGPAPLTYSWGDDGRIKFTAERHPPRPASYFEAFKTYVNETNVFRKSDYKETTVTARVAVHLAWESSLKPIKRVVYEFSGAKDDAGRDLEVLPGTTLDAMPVIGGGIFMMGGFEDVDLSAPQSFTLKGFTPESKSVALLKGTAKLTFPLARVEVRFDDPQGGSKTTVGDITIRLNKVTADKILLSFSKPKGEAAGLKEEILSRIDAASVVAVDEGGKEHAGEMAPAGNRDMAGGIVVMAGGPSGEQVRKLDFQATFPNLAGKDIKQFRFKFSDSLYEKTVPFEIRDIKLP